MSLIKCLKSLILHLYHILVVHLFFGKCSVIYRLIRINRAHIYVLSADSQIQLSLLPMFASCMR